VSNSSFEQNLSAEKKYIFRLSSVCRHRPAYSSQQDTIVNDIIGGAVDPSFLPAIEPLLLNGKVVLLPYFPPPHTSWFFSYSLLLELCLGWQVDLAVWGHVHNYERTCAVYESKCLAFPSNVNGVDTYNNTDYKAPVHAVIGMAGFTLDSFSTAVSRPLTFPDLDLLLLWRVL
jgi:hypothetical protein